MSQPISSGTISITNSDIRNSAPAGGPNYGYWSSGVTYYDYDDGNLPTGAYTAAGAISVATAIRGILYLGYRNIVQTWNSSYNTWQYEYKVTQLALWRQLGLRSSNSGYGATVWDRATTLINQGKALSNVYPVNNFSVFKFTRTGALTLIGVSNVVKLSLNANGGNAASYAGLSYVWMPQSVASPLPPAITRNNSGDVNSFTISFNANGGTSTPSAITNKKYYSYSFYRWAINSSSYYAASSNYTPTAATSMYASWSETAHQRAITLPAAISHNNGTASRTVTFNANGGSVSPTSKTSTATVTYSFNGWHWGSASGTTYAAKASYTPSATGTMYAGWNSSTGTFSAITTPTPTRTGYSCKGWYTSTTSTTRRATAGGSYTPSANETVYAQWTANTYTVTLNKNGGSGGTNSVTATYGSAMPSATMPTRTGYTFAGYYDATSGGTQYYTAAGASARAWNKTAATTLYARWTANTYTVAYALNGGSQAHTNGQRVASGNFTFVYNPTTVAYNMSNFAALNSSHPVNGYFQVDRPTRTGYTFSHWIISGMDSTEHLYYGTNGRTSFTSTSIDTRNTAPANPAAWAQLRATAGTVTFTANWIEITATLSFNMLGGSGGPSAITMKYTTATTIPAASTWPTSTGYTCIGWATSEARAKNGNVDYTAGATYKAANVVPTATTLYAVWRSTVSYNANNGTGAPGASYMYYTPAFTVSTTVPTRTGYTFDHWNTAADNSGTSFSSGAQLKAANAWRVNTTLYAQWNRNLFNVTINLDGGTQPNGRDVLTYNGSDTSLTIVHNPTVASYDMKNFTPLSGSVVNEFMAIDRPTKTGYTFNHWVITGMENITHYTWIGSGAVAFTGTTYDTSAFTDPTAPSYQHLRATAGTVTFTAHYTANQYNLIVYPNGGVFNNSTSDVTFSNGLTYDGTNNNTLGLPTKTGYSFDGWWTDPVNGELVYDAIAGEAVQGTYWSTTGSNAVYKYTGNLSVYARWKPSGVVRWQYKLVDDNGNEIVDGDGNNIVSVQKYAVFRWNGTAWERCSPYGYHNNEWKIGE